MVRSGRKTLSVEIHPDGKVLVRAPYRVTDRKIKEFMGERENWIRKHLAKLENMPQPDLLSEEELRSLAEDALSYFPPRTRYYAELMGMDYGRITIRSQKTRWGSCSGKGNLNFNCLLMLMPEEIREYVIVHELAHRKEMNHSAAFWSLVERYMPDYRQRRKWLKEHGDEYMRRLYQ